MQRSFWLVLNEGDAILFEDVVMSAVAKYRGAGAA